MKNALTYITRRCPRHCEYCSIRDAKDVGKELNVNQWIDAFKILREMGCTFNLIIGNEPWILGDNLLRILKTNQIPYAMYTTCPEPWFSKHREKFFSSGVVDSLSCGIDYPVKDFTLNIKDHSYAKSKDAFEGFKWVKKHYPKVDVQGTITLHKLNIPYVIQLAKDLQELDVFIGFMFLHWNIDNGYDFFPPKEEISNLMFTKEDWSLVDTTLHTLLDTKAFWHHPEFMRQPASMLTTMGWHCKGDPYGGPSVDSDGTLRVCGYRKGTRTPKFSIFDLPKLAKEWQEAVYEDAMDCPGCSWSFPWEYHYWKEKDPAMGEAVYTQHAGSHIPKNKWSQRNINGKEKI